MAMPYSDLLLYLDILPDPPRVGPLSHSPEMQHHLYLRANGHQLDDPGMIIIFLKHFDAMRQTLFGIGNLWVPRTMEVGDLVPTINERMKWASGTPLKLYEVTGVTRFHRYDVPIRHPSIGNQTWHDRVHETEVDPHQM